MKPRGKMGGPPSKPKYYLMTDSEKYSDGKLKRTALKTQIQKNNPELEVFDITGFSIIIRKSVNHFNTTLSSTGTAPSAILIFSVPLLTFKSV